MTRSDGHRGDFTDVRRRGIKTATAVFDRFIEEVDLVYGRRPRLDDGVEGFDDDGSEAAPRDIPQLRAAVARTIDLYAELFQRTFEVYADVVENVLRERRARGSGADGSPVALAGAPGGQAHAAVWIHNSTDAPVSGVSLRMTDLTAHDGARLEASLASFSPQWLEVAPAASRSSTLSAAIPPSAAAGTYYGHVLATGLPGVSLPVCVVVEP
jgi:hypothetical protein